MKENSANRDRDRFKDEEQENSNLPDRARENETPASGIKNNDAWITGMEAKTPMQETNPPSYESTTSDNLNEQSRYNANKDADQWKTGGEFRDPDEWKRSDSSSESQKTGNDADQNNAAEKENSF
ncbi:MAG TPA: hypothetical protein VNA26_04955 [Chitinophagaceae bacterium]|nr:hypothetical protein [Chitinophagaceae bacterium]